MTSKIACMIKLAPKSTTQIVKGNKTRLEIDSWAPQASMDSFSSQNTLLFFLTEPLFPVVNLSSLMWDR